MGLFSDVFGGKNSGDLMHKISGKEGIKSAVGSNIWQNVHDVVRGKQSFKEGGAFAAKDALIAGASVTGGAHLLSANTTREGFSKLMGSDDDVNPPPVDKLPAQGAGARSAKQRARQQALAAAKKRFGFGDTVATSPLGLQGDGAPLGKKTLIGA